MTHSSKSGLQLSSIFFNYLLVCVCICLFVCLSVCLVHTAFGKRAIGIWMRFLMGRWIRQVVAFGDQFTGEVNVGGECGAPHCNQWGVCGIAVQKCANRSCCSLGWCIVSALCKGKGRFGRLQATGAGCHSDAVLLAQTAICFLYPFLFVLIFTFGVPIGSPTGKCFWFVCENLMISIHISLESSIRRLVDNMFSFKIKVVVYKTLAKT